MNLPDSTTYILAKYLETGTELLENQVLAFDAQGIITQLQPQSAIDKNLISARYCLLYTSPSPRD